MGIPVADGRHTLTSEMSLFDKPWDIGVPSTAMTAVYAPVLPKVPEEITNQIETGPQFVLDVVLKFYGVNSGTQLANDLGVNRRTIHNRRNGHVAISTDDLTAMADALSVPVGLFFDHHLDANVWLSHHRSEQFRCTERTLEKD